MAFFHTFWVTRRLSRPGLQREITKASKSDGKEIHLIAVNRVISRVSSFQQWPRGGTINYEVFPSPPSRDYLLFGFDKFMFSLCGLKILWSSPLSSRGCAFLIFFCYDCICRLLLVDRLRLLTFFVFFSDEFHYFSFLQFNFFIKDPLRCFSCT